MDGHAIDAEQAGSYDRRQVLRRGAMVVGAATLWATPVVQTLGMRPAAAGSADGTEPGGSLCPPGSETSAQPRDLVFRWNGGGGTSTALIVIQRPGKDRLYAVVGVGGFFQIANQAGSNWRVGVYDPTDVPAFSGRGGAWRNLPESGGLIDASEFHTSCSVPLSLGDRFGTITLVAGTPPGGDQGQHVLAGVTLANVQVATSNPAVHSSADEQELKADDVEVDDVEVEPAEPEPTEVAPAEAEATEPVEAETEKVEDIRGENDAPVGADDAPPS
jgi:hypothetical protein